jgi:hypothetical protein
MSLKKSDKIIAIFGVIILIVAAIGIVLYVPEDGDDAPKEVEEKKKISFEVQMNEDMFSEPRFDLDLKLPSLFSLLSRGKSYVNKNFYTIQAENVKSIIFEFEFEDKQKSFGFLPFIFKLLNNPIGTDIVNVVITDPNDETISRVLASGTKKNITIDVPLHPIPKDIEAYSQEEAEQILSENYSFNDWVEMPFGISVSLTIEGRLRFFKRIRERFFKDTVTVKISYITYSLDPVRIKTDDNDNNNDDDSGTNYNGYGSLSFSMLNYWGKL